MDWRKKIGGAIAGVVLLLGIILGLRVDLNIDGLGWQKTVGPRVYTVYFASADSVGLVPEYRQGEGTVQERLTALLNGPKTAGKVGVLPRGTKVLGYWLKDDVLFVNFSMELMLNHPGGSSGELITVYGIVNSLCGAPGVKKVQILVDGMVRESLRGHVDIQAPLSPDFNLTRNNNI